MRSDFFRRRLKILPFAVLLFALIGLVVMSLWNWLIPPVFGWSRIGYWQAWGLIVLSKILFSGWHRPGDRSREWRHRMMERWDHMTPEEREHLRQKLRGPWDREAPPDPKAGA
jgi:hypothetical protein